MNAEQAWRSVLAQLQLDMPRASFDTWVRDTRPVSYLDGILTIGVRNAYARDWLESRLAGTVNRLLVGVLDAGASVNFVVSDVGEVSELDVFSDASEEAEDPGPEDEQELTALEYDSVYEQIVKPRRGAYVLGYFRRWLRWLGPELAWMYIAFFQAVYMAGSRSGRQPTAYPAGRSPDLQAVPSAPTGVASKSLIPGGNSEDWSTSAIMDLNGTAVPRHRDACLADTALP